MLWAYYTDEGLRPYPYPTLPYQSWPYNFILDIQVSFLARLLQVLSTHQNIHSREKPAAQLLMSTKWCTAVQLGSRSHITSMHSTMWESISTDLPWTLREKFSFILHVSFALASRDTLDSLHSILIHQKATLNSALKDLGGLIWPTSAKLLHLTWNILLHLCWWFYQQI